MIESFKNMFKIPELRKRIFFTLAILAVYRVGCHIPTPGVDSRVLVSWFETAGKGSLFGLYNLFAGGAFSRATVFSLGIMPYISASIIIQLLGAVIPYFQKLQKEGEEGRRKITQYTRYGTVLLSAMQALGTTAFLESISEGGMRAVPHPGLQFKLMTMLTFSCGTILIMWLGERITERGIGNGISLIIFIGIVARLPSGIIDEFNNIRLGERSILEELGMILIMLAVIWAIVAVTSALRKIPVQYAKRVVGRKMYGGQSTHIPLSVNTAGIIPIIFAQSLMFAPTTLAQFFPESSFSEMVYSMFDPAGVVYSVMYGLLIVFFAYFYTAIVFNPVDLADNMKKYGGFIPGIRPGKNTAEYIDHILTRITLPGATFFAFIAILPTYMMRTMNVQFYFGGTSILIMVGVALDTLQQIESHLVMRHYDGFMKRGRIKGRF